HGHGVQDLPTPLLFFRFDPIDAPKRPILHHCGRRSSLAQSAGRGWGEGVSGFSHSVLFFRLWTPLMRQSVRSLTTAAGDPPSPSPLGEGWGEGVSGFSGFSNGRLDSGSRKTAQISQPITKGPSP